MGEVWINRRRNDLTTNFPELIGSIAERDDLSGTHKGEVQGIEEKDNVFACSSGVTDTTIDHKWIVKQAHSLQSLVV